MDKIRSFFTPSVVAVFILMFFSTAGVWYLHPLTRRVTLKPAPIQNKTNLSCASVAGTGLFTNLNLLQNPEPPRVDALLLKDTTHLKITLHANTVDVVIDPEFADTSKPPKAWNIVKNTPLYILAQSIDTDTYNEYASSFALNKETGFAVWTRAEPTVLNSTFPSATSYFLECK